MKLRFVGTVERGLVCAAVLLGAMAAPASYGQEEPAPAFKLYCSCRELFGRTTLNLMSYNPQTKQEQKVREIAKISGSAVYPAMQNCRKAIEKQVYAECLPVNVLAPAPLEP